MDRNILNPSPSHLWVISPTGMSGTNFLVQALLASAICVLPKKEVLAREDHLLVNFDLLEQYVKNTLQIWRRWESDEILLQLRENELMRSIGDGLRQFAGQPDESGRRLVFKTPTSRHLGAFPDLFPESQLIVLVRDGRDSTESEVRAAYRSSHEAAFTIWAERTRELLDFIRGRGREWGSDSWMLVRYEELVISPAATLTSIASFLGVDGASIDDDRIFKLPVFGSSELGTANCSAFRWCVKDRPQGFSPIGRWSRWDLERRSLFKRIAGKELIELGYEKDDDW